MLDVALQLEPLRYSTLIVFKRNGSVASAEPRSPPLFCCRGAVQGRCTCAFHVYTWWLGVVVELDLLVETQPGELNAIGCGSSANILERSTATWVKLLVLRVAFHVDIGRHGVLACDGITT